MNIFHRINRVLKNSGHSLPLAGPTITYGDFISIYSRQVEVLSYSRQLDLAITISQLLLPDYYRFYEIHQWGNPDLLLDAINILKTSTLTPIDTEEIRKMALEVDLITPHMDDFGDNISSYALNACIAVYEGLQFLIYKDHSHTYNIGIS